MQHLYYFAGVAELADAPDLGSGVFRCAGSTPVTRTKNGLNGNIGSVFSVYIKTDFCQKQKSVFYLLLSFTPHKVSCTTFAADLKSSASAGKTSAVYCCTTAGASTVTAVLLYFCPGYG